MATGRGCLRPCPLAPFSPVESCRWRASHQLYAFGAWRQPAAMPAPNAIPGLNGFDSAAAAVAQPHADTDAGKIKTRRRVAPTAPPRSASAWPYLHVTSHTSVGSAAGFVAKNLAQHSHTAISGNWTSSTAFQTLRILRCARLMLLQGEGQVPIWQPSLQRTRRSNAWEPSTHGLHVQSATQAITVQQHSAGRSRPGRQHDSANVNQAGSSSNSSKAATSPQTELINNQQGQPASSGQQQPIRRRKHQQQQPAAANGRSGMPSRQDQAELASWHLPTAPAGGALGVPYRRGQQPAQGRQRLLLQLEPAADDWHMAGQDVSHAVTRAARDRASLKVQPWPLANGVAQTGSRAGPAATAASAAGETVDLTDLASHRDVTSTPIAQGYIDRQASASCNGAPTQRAQQCGSAAVQEASWLTEPAATEPPQQASAPVMTAPRQMRRRLWQADSSALNKQAHAGAPGTSAGEHPMAYRRPTQGIRGWVRRGRRLAMPDLTAGGHRPLVFKVHKLLAGPMLPSIVLPVSAGTGADALAHAICKRLTAASGRASSPPTFTGPNQNQTDAAAGEHLVALDSFGPRAALISLQALLMARELLQGKQRDLAVVLQSTPRPGRDGNSTVLNRFVVFECAPGKPSVILPHAFASLGWRSPQAAPQQARSGHTN